MKEYCTASTDGRRHSIASDDLPEMPVVLNRDSSAMPSRSSGFQSSKLLKIVTPPVINPFCSGEKSVKLEKIASPRVTTPPPNSLSRSSTYPDEKNLAKEEEKKGGFDVPMAPI